MPDNHRRGFTLVEVLLTVIISGLLMMAVFKMLYYGMTVYRMVNTQMHGEALAVLDGLGRDLRGAYVAADGDNLFMFQGGPSSLRFTSSARLVNDASELPVNDLVLREYVVRVPAEEQRPALICRSQDIWTGSTGDSGEAPMVEHVVARGIQSWLVQYYDGAEWKDVWQSSVFLPSAVRIEVTLGQGSGGRMKPEIFSTVITLPNGL